MELILEIVFEFIIEGVFYIYFELMALIVPNFKGNKAMKKKFKRIVKVFSALLIVALIVGLILLMPPITTVNTAGKIIIFTVLLIIGIQVLAGIIFRIIYAIKNKYKEKEGKQ